MDMGDGRTHPTSEKGRGALAACLTWLEEGEHFQLLKTLQVLRGAREGNAWYIEALGKSSQGKRVVRKDMSG